MFRKHKQTEDIESHENSSATSEEPQSKSFMIGGGTRTVTLTLPDVPLVKKEAYKKQPYCIICLRNFTNFFRQHHCRVCANASCNQCSRSLVNKERTCDLCIMKLSNPAEQKKKAEVISTLETLCAYLVYRRNVKMNELQVLKSAPKKQEEDLARDIQSQERSIKGLQAENSSLKEQKDSLQFQLQKVRQANAQFQQSISQIERQLSNEIDRYS